MPFIERYKKKTPLKWHTIMQYFDHYRTVSVVSPDVIRIGISANFIQPPKTALQNMHGRDNTRITILNVTSNELQKYHNRLIRQTCHFNI